MANDYALLGSAVYGALGSATALGVYANLAPQGSVTPYVVFSRQTGLDEYMFGKDGVSADYLVKVVGTALWPTSLYAHYGSVHAGFQDARLTVTGYTALRCRRTSTVEYRDSDGFWHVGGLYRIEIVT